MQQQLAHGDILFVRILQKGQVVGYFIGQIDAPFVVELHHGKHRGHRLGEGGNVINIGRQNRGIFSLLTPRVGAKTFVVHAVAVFQHHNLATGIGTQADALFGYLVYFIQGMGVHAVFIRHDVGGCPGLQRHPATRRKRAADAGRQAPVHSRFATHDACRLPLHLPVGRMDQQHGRPCGSHLVSQRLYLPALEETQVSHRRLGRELLEERLISIQVPVGQAH